VKVRHQRVLVGAGVVLGVVLLLLLVLRIGEIAPQPDAPSANMSPSIDAEFPEVSFAANPTGEPLELLDLWSRDDLVREHLEEVADRSPLPSACVSFGTVRWLDGSPAADARIETLITRRHGASGTSWEDTGVQQTDAEGNYELPAQDICPLRLAASAPRRRPGPVEVRSLVHLSRVKPPTGFAATSPSNPSARLMARSSMWRADRFKAEWPPTLTTGSSVAAMDSGNLRAVEKSGAGDSGPTRHPPMTKASSPSMACPTATGR